MRASVSSHYTEAKTIWASFKSNALILRWADGKIERHERITVIPKREIEIDIHLPLWKSLLQYIIISSLNETMVALKCIFHV